LFITKPFIVLVVVGAVIAPVVSKVPFIVTALFSSSIKFISPANPTLLALKRTPPIKPAPLTSIF